MDVGAIFNSTSLKIKLKEQKREKHWQVSLLFSDIYMQKI
jgi:hypothetical protein